MNGLCSVRVEDEPPYMSSLKIAMVPSNCDIRNPECGLSVDDRYWNHD